MEREKIPVHKSQQSSFRTCLYELSIPEVNLILPEEHPFALREGLLHI